MGRGGHDSLAGKSGITSDEKKGQCCELWAISHPIVWCSVFRLRGNPYFELSTEFPGILCDSGR